MPLIPAAPGRTQVTASARRASGAALMGDATELVVILVPPVREHAFSEITSAFVGIARQPCRAQVLDAEPGPPVALCG